MTRLQGRAAIEHAQRTGAVLHKYADPIEGARDNLTADDAYAVALEDSSLIWCEDGQAATLLERGDALRALLDASVRWARDAQTMAGSDEAADAVRKAALDYARACHWTPPAEGQGTSAGGKL